MTDAELARYLRVPESVVASLTPQKRERYEQLAHSEIGIKVWVAGELARIREMANQGTRR